MRFAADKERKIITGALMIADMPIYRRNEKMGEFYVVFDKGQIEKIAQRFMRNGYNDNVNKMHDSKDIVDGVYMYESFITDSQRGILAPRGFENTPEGTWFGSYKVDNKEIDLLKNKVWRCIEEAFYTPEEQLKISITLETTSQRELRKKTEETQSVEDIKAAKDVQKKDIETIGKETKSAKLQELAARDMFTFASDPALDKMFGVLNSKPGYTSAFFLALKEPVRIGNTSIGVGQIEDILRLANIKDPAVIAAAERFKGLSKQIEANETRILLGGEGQITEGERRIVTAIVPTLSDPKEVVKAKAELTIARAQFDQERAKAFNAYMRQNKNATYYDFESDPNSPYQKLWSNYREHTADIADSYSKSGTKTKRDSSATSAKSTSPVKSGGLWEAIQRAKEAE